MRTVFALFLLLAAMTSVIGRQPGSAHAHILVAYRTVGMIVPGLTPLMVLDVPEDAISRELSVAVTTLDSTTDGISRELSISVPATHNAGNAWSRETSIRVAPGPGVPDAISRELSIEWDPDKPYYAHSRAVSVGGSRSLTVRVEFQDIDPLLAPTTVALTILDPDGGTLMDTNAALTNGEITVPAMPRMHLRVYAKASHWLRRMEVVAHGSSDLVELSLLNGDCDEDNEITIGDYALLSAAFGSAEGDPNWNASADLNGDLEVDIGDFAILSSNFGEVGD
ncbi:MAG TPA: dockerin type I domain-containing protein [Fimbriimonadaceae bacterium]|nr:dockerin type I domain-containing protein [Fimbriimonadaceae bacterium]HRJ97041.1 dockerin type I domain-containing protein [Fimbriimonadaceae bacterium]